MGKCTMKHIQSIYNDVPKTKGYALCNFAEIRHAESLYAKMTNTSKKEVVIDVPKGQTAIGIARALEVRHFPYYKMNIRWYSVETVNGEKKMTIFNKYFSENLKRNDALRTTIPEIIHQLNISEATDEKDAVRLIADYIEKTADYDYYGTAGFYGYDCLIRHKCICCGFAEAFKMLCDYCGIRCQCVQGDGHQWNRVKIDDKWLNVDVTYLDNGLAKKVYLLTDDETFYENHEPLSSAMAKYWIYEG